MGPSPWVVRFASLISVDGDVLDVACGAGRHTRLFLDRGQRVVAIDRDLSGVADLAGNPRLERVQTDLEDGTPFALAGRRFAGVVVTNYLHRPLMPALVAAVDAGGVLIYETFAVGSERFGGPKNPDFLLRPGELLDTVRKHLRVIAYEDLVVGEPSPAAIQRVCALGPSRPYPFSPRFRGNRRGEDRCRRTGTPGIGWPKQGKNVGRGPEPLDIARREGGILL